MTTTTTTLSPALYIEYAATLAQFNTAQAHLDYVKSREARWRLRELRPAGLKRRPERQLSTSALVRHEFALDQRRILKDAAAEITANLKGRAMTDGEQAVFDALANMKARLKETRARLEADRPWLDGMRASMKATRDANLAVLAAARRQIAQ